MHMRRINSSRVSLAISLVALFVALGGTAVAVSKIGTSQIKNGAVTDTKLHAAAVTSGKIKAGAVGTTQLARGAVTRPKLAPASVTTSAIADNAVTSSKVADGTLTSGDVAPNTFLAANGTAADSAKLGGRGPNGFLAANGTAADSAKLGGLGPGAYVSGTGKLRSARLVLAPSTGATEFLELDFGHISGVCDAGGVGKLRFVADLPVDNLIAWATGPGVTVDIQTSNALGGGSFYEEPHSVPNPQEVTFQAAVNDGSTEQLATAWTTVQTAGGQCIFTGQAITTL
jgi:hypothetical protein